MRDAELQRILAAEVAWTDAASRCAETLAALTDAIGAVPLKVGRDPLDADLAKLDEFARSTLTRVSEYANEHLEAIGDDAQLANVDLQNVLQKQQQTLQMLSNISKMLHDTAMSTIRKIGG